MAICGFGSAGRQHAAAVAELPDVTVHSVLEADPAVRTDPYPRAADWASVLADPRVDAVALCVPPGGRAELAAAAVAAGKAVLLEKPPCMSVAELDQLEALDGRIGVMLQHRFRLPAEVLDRPFRAAAGTLLVSRHRVPARHYTGWRADPGRSLGGITAHLGVHYLDLACQALGDVEAVDVVEHRSCAPGIDVRVGAVVRFAAGSTLAVTIAADVPARAEQLVIVGGDRYLSIADGAVVLRDGDAERTVPAAPTPALRGRVYTEFTSGGELCSLARSRGATRILDEVRKAGTGW